MNVKDRLLKSARIIVPIVVIFLMTLCCCYLYLFKGIAGGDDIKFHLGNVYDVYYGMKNGLSIDSTNHLLMGAYAYNTHLFYAPLPHYGAAILMYIFGITSINAVKTFVFLLTFFAGVMFYCLAYKISKKVVVSLLSAAFFIFCPYRMFCGYARFAYAETIAMCFIPCFFYGIYSITHDNEPKALSFLTVVVGACGLILSHPFTAVTMALVAILYMAVHFKGVWSFIKTKKGIIYSLSAVVLIILGVGFYAFPMVKALGSGLYRISDDAAVWTTYEHVSGSTLNSSAFSGFFNFVWINSKIEANAWNTDWSPAMLTLSVCLVFIGAILAAVADFALGKLPFNKFYRLPIMIVVSFLPICFFVQRIEVYLSLALYDVILIIAEYLKEKTEGYFEKKGWFKRNKDAVIDLIFLVVVSAIALVFIYVGKAWKIVPSFFYSCQFAWRLWSVVSLTTSWAFICGINATTYIKNTKAPFYLAAIVPFLLFSTSQAYLEKKYVIDNSSIYQSYAEEECKQANNIGVMNEYIPAIFYDSSYKSEYSNSLYRKIRNTIGYSSRYQRDTSSYLTPVFLEGSGMAFVTELNTPSVDFEISVDDEALIQIPQFFYDGYEIKATDTSNKVTTELEPVNVDCLVSFKLNAGSYRVEVRYVGPKVRRVFNVLWYVGLAGDVALGSYGIYELINKKHKEKEQEVA